MNRLFCVLSLATVLMGAHLYGEEAFCRKCHILREYHEKNPSKYEYYDDYLKDIEKYGEEAVNPSLKDLPEDVQFIMDPKKSVK